MSVVNSRRRLLCGGALAFLAACGNLETHTLDVQIAASGVQREAGQVVALVYGQADDTAFAKLLYAGGDLNRAALRLRDRHAQLRPWLEQGVIGNALGGYLVLRDAARRAELGALLDAENDDRAWLYREVAIASGHGGTLRTAWLPYVEQCFGREWQAQGAADWWRTDARHIWHTGAKVGAGDTAR